MVNRAIRMVDSLSRQPAPSAVAPQTALVRRARTGGLSWAEIAFALGISRQAAHRKYGGSRFGRS